MRARVRWFVLPLACIAIVLVPALARATDVDGNADCPRPVVDRGDAPEAIQAYPGILGAFPTCTTAGPLSTRTFACPPLGSLPGPAGFVAHVRVPGEGSYWLGCFAGAGGIDDDADGKVNDHGGPFGVCAPGVAIDCVEPAFGLSFGQDECTGSNDAALSAVVGFTACTASSVTFPVWNCAAADTRTVRLNILVDWNRDGDWNDSFQCATGCANEWAVKNEPVTIGPGCTSITSPSFLAGPSGGEGWMRITISNDSVSDDFPWAGCATTPGQVLLNGETEDYPVTIFNPTGGLCPDFEDWGDAPEGVQAYSVGSLGNFPTCSSPGSPGTQELAGPPLSTPPVASGHVQHVALASDPKFWLGCGAPALGTFGIDSEQDGKMNATGALQSDCDPLVGVDGVEAAFAVSFGRDEARGDLEGDAGLVGPVSFTGCTRDSLTFLVFNCDPFEAVTAYLNVLLDFNQDGDWNDNFACGSQPGGPLAHEWAVKNQQVLLPVGCTSMSSRSFLVGPNGGESWMRLTLSLHPVGDDFPWAGGPLVSGESEDYPVTIAAADTCPVTYEDFGDAPEDVAAYTSGVVGRFPTCLVSGPRSDQVLDCGAAQSTLPGRTGYVKHASLATHPDHFWLGCAQATSALLAVDSESDGKVNLGAPWGGASACDPVVNTDCAESLIGLGMNQDECVGDADAALAAPTYFYACSTGTMSWSAFNCTRRDLPVFLNVLVDWSHDGDWNDNAAGCPGGPCAPEWAVKNLAVVLAPGCQTYVTPAFATGAVPGRAWLRMTLSNEPAPDDFPWAGTAGLAAGQFFGGETEDHPVNVVTSTTAVDDRSPPTGPWLGAPSPNPARGPVRIPFALARAGEVSLGVYDLAGRRLVELRRGTAAAGPQEVLWDLRDGSGKELAPGHYVVRLRAGGAVLSRALVRLD